MAFTKEEKIKKMLLEAISLEIKNTLLNLISDICIWVDEPIEYAASLEIQELFDEVKKSIFELNDDIICAVEDRSVLLEKIGKLKEEAFGIYNTFCCYKKAFEFLVCKFNNEIANKLNEELMKEHNKLDFDKIYDDCIDFIYDEEEDERLTELLTAERKGVVLSCMPMKMTRQKYENFIYNNLKISCENSKKGEMEIVFDNLKTSFYPFNSKFFGKKYPVFAEQISEMNNIDLTKLSQDEIGELIDNILDSSQNLESLNESLESIYNDLNYMFSLALFCADEEFLFEEDILFKDMYFSSLNLLKGELDVEFAGDVIEKIDEKVSAIQDERISLKNNIVELLPMFDNVKVSEQLKTYIDTYKTINKYFWENIEDAIAEKTYAEFDGEVDEKFFDEKFGEFFEYVNNSIAEFTNKDKKAVKAYFLSKIYCVVKDEEFIEYFDFVFDQMKDSDDLSLFAMKFGQVLEAYGFDVSDDECDCGYHHEHNHSHNCGCEHHHEHNHSHNCGCGHHH